MHLLLDGDILVYRIGFASQDVEAGFAFARMNTFINEIRDDLGSDEHTVFLTSEDKSNFRYAIYPEYKANRKAPKPQWYKELRAHLIADHQAVVVSGREADDAMADTQDEESCICTIDKDLDQVPGEHYDFVKKVRYTVSPTRGLRFFYYQLLTGDRTDNIPGIEGIGPKKAEKYLAGVESDEQSLFRAVRGAYEEHYKKRGDELMLLNGRLLKIGGPLWEFPVDTEVKDSEATLNDTLQPS